METKTIDAKMKADAKELSKEIAKAFKTADSFENFVSRLGVNNDNTLSAGTYQFNLVTRNRVLMEAAYRGSWIVGAVVDSVAEDMTRAGINITTNEGEDDLKDLMTAISRKKISSSLCSMKKWARLYGGALAVMQIKGQDLATPLDIETVGKDQFEGLVVFDRWQLNPVLDQVIKSGADTGLPVYYDIVTTAAQTDPNNKQNETTGQIRVHYSRVIRNVGIELPFFQAMTENFWGESVLERMWDRLIAFDNATMSSASLIDRANLRTVQVDGLRDIIGAGGAAIEGLYSQFEMMRSLQVNEGLTLLDKEDLFSSTAYSFAGLSDMLLQFAQQLSGASEIPLIRLYGQAPAGLSGNSDGEIRLYYDNINASQEADLRAGWDKILKVMYRSTFNKAAPKDLEFTFVPLWQMSAMDKANIAKTETETIIGAFDSGLVDRPTAMKELRGASGDTGLFSNISDEDIKEAELEPPPMPETTPEPDVENPATAKEPVKNLDSKWDKLKAFLVGS